MLAVLLLLQAGGEHAVHGGPSPYTVDMTSLLDAAPGSLHPRLAAVVAAHARPAPGGRAGARRLGRAGVRAVLDALGALAPAVRARRTFGALIDGFAAELSALDASALRLLGLGVERDLPIATAAAGAVPPWALDRLDQRQLPLDGHTSSPPGEQGAGVSVYVIDTGINYAHAEFDGRVGDGYDFVRDRPRADDCHGHGTHCAGSCCGATFGIAPLATIHPLRTLDCNGAGFTSATLAALEWVAEHDAAGRPKVVSLSLTSGRHELTNRMVAALHARGIVVTVAAGNEGTDACTRSPASAPDALTVGASTTADHVASFSNFGPCVDVFAPGVNIVSAWIGSRTRAVALWGTSMACPHVAGICARLLGAAPTLSATAVSERVLAMATAGLLTATAPRNNEPNLLAHVAPGLGLPAPAAALAPPPPPPFNVGSGVAHPPHRPLPSPSPGPLPSPKPPPPVAPPAERSPPPLGLAHGDGHHPAPPPPATPPAERSPPPLGLAHGDGHHPAPPPPAAPPAERSPPPLGLAHGDGHHPAPPPPATPPAERSPPPSPPGRAAARAPPRAEGSTAAPSACTVVTIELTPDRHIRDTSWRLSRADGSTVISGGQYNFLAFNTTRSQSACMPDGRYNFAIFDEEGDGLCCEHGHGQFRVLVAGAEVARGATFRSQATVPVLVGASVSAGALESFNANVSLLSSAVSIEVTLDNRPEDNEWEVLDDNGVIVMAGWRSKEQLLFPGRYHFRMYDSRADGMCCAHCDHNACGYKLSVDAQLVATGGSFAGRPYDERGFVIAELLNPECYKHDDAFDYRGTVSSTRTGQRCQPWTDQTPHAHAYVHAVYPDAGLGAHSYCRNPGHAEPTAWCMPQNPSRERELCDVGEPRRNCRRWQLLKELRAAAAADPSVSAAGMLPLSLGIASPGTGLHKTPALLQMAQGERPEARHPMRSLAKGLAACGGALCAVALVLLVLGDGATRPAALRQPPKQAERARVNATERDACVSAVETAQSFQCGHIAADQCEQELRPASLAKPCPDDKMQDAYHVEDGTCVQICLPPGLANIAAHHGVRYGMSCFLQTPLNSCTRWYLTGTRAGVRYFAYFCLTPCSSAQQACNGSTDGEYARSARRGPARPRWSGDWWPGVPNDELERQNSVCAARQPASAPAEAKPPAVSARALAAASARHSSGPALHASRRSEGAMRWWINSPDEAG
ncbi:hypothetical protein KFE25_010756 [Diacronema lutheri]|uniref:Kringle domain-containing protein n=1 Tax=Diacronema lutheri TaxID=2081491 RepID=A0A8J5XLC2_DIALT|nr:hypothetical protein KFE25_010756 [Diacronema lutheri]